MHNRYNFPVLAEWILMHKANCNRLQKKHGFMVTLCNYIRIRNNAFAFRVEKYGEESFSNISVFKPETANNAHSESQNFNELGVRDSPYAIGRPTFGWDPHTGQRSTKPSSSTLVSTSNKAAISNAGMAPTSSTPNNFPPKPDQGRNPRGSGYKGRNFNPNHSVPSRRRGKEDGPGASGYPFGFRYPLTFSAKSDIRIRWRIPADIRPKNDPQAAK
ncbi:hypothetical protein PGTUg99_004929 [Puccinia graminis f. sp. tritici]|uniref:Uncharacterized protein n=1 Tax=Puccinia graminis f. sp. tritici TaxID=56615 RepID=A0A5B0Q108_PUCGR|nr:hypothetical protein PGTUg99_004929 [Puccinia graminis f. sp. tritici]